MHRLAPGGGEGKRQNTMAARYQLLGRAGRMIGEPDRRPGRKQVLEPLAEEIGEDSLDFRKLRRSHSTFYAVLNVHPRVAQMSMGQGSFSTTLKY